MKQRERIERGDIVQLSFHGAQITLCHRAEVLYCPSEPFDAWILRDEDGRIHDVSEPCSVTLITPHELKDK